MMSGLHSWLLDKSTSDTYMFIKRLSANDTGATGGHQVGIYIPSGIVEHLFPSINHTRDLNPSVTLNAHTSSHSCPDREVRAVYYNGRFLVRPEMKSVLPDGEEERILCKTLKTRGRWPY